MKTMNLNLAGANVYIRGGWTSVVVLIIGILLMVMSIWLGFWSFLAGLILFGGVCVANAFIVVLPENAAYAIVLGKTPRKSLLPGWHFVVPFVTEVVHVRTKQDTYELNVENIDTSEVYKMGFSFAIKFGINPDYAWMEAKDISTPIETKHLYPLLRELLIKHVSPLTCQRIKDDETLRIQMMEDIKDEFLTGAEALFSRLSGAADFIQNLELKFNDFNYDSLYVSRINDLEASRIQAEIAQQKAKADIEEAKGISQATVEIATGDAKAIELKGGAENAVLEEKGRILTEKPAISENEAAKHVPQTVVTGGGITPVMDIMRSLYPHDDSSAPTPTPAPTSTATAGAAAGATVNVNVSPTPPTP